MVDFGHIDPGISPGITTVTPVAPSGSYMAVVPFTPLNGSNGVYHVCTQTKDPSSRYVTNECIVLSLLTYLSNGARI